MMSTQDKRYFQTTKKGVLRELQDDLNSVNKKKIKEAVKKVIALMAIGKDVGMLFSDVIKSMGSDNVELKKLVYLYIINYASNQPEKAILCVGMFQKDATNNPNPLLRALAIRTMSNIRVERITEYLTDPVCIALKDEDAYVRKTAVIAVSKLYCINPELAEERGLIERLRKMLSDINPMVVANAVAALTDISDISGIDHFKIDNNILSKLLTALSECTEWGRVFILDALSKFMPSTNAQIYAICDQVLPQLRHSNSAVVMTSVKIIIKLIQLMDNKQNENKYCKELVSPLITLLSSRPEIQYVTLRNIDLIVQKYPKLFVNHCRLFCVKYDDEIFLKKQKLDILKKLATSENYNFVLSELTTYSQEIDIDFVKLSVSSIGYIAMKLECAASQCVKILSDLVRTGINYIVEQSIIVIRDIFRRYPNSYQKLIVTICDNLESLNNAEAKASFIWIIGENAERIIDAGDRLEYFIDSFESEEIMVQLQILTSTVKLFLKKPDKTKALVQKVLKLATEASDNPDLRDRGYVYWRLLSTDPTIARKVVLCDRPAISHKSFKDHLPKDFLSDLLNNLSTLSSVYHSSPINFAADYGTSFQHHQTDDDDESSSTDYSSSTSSSTDSSEDDDSESMPSTNTTSTFPMQTVIDSSIKIKIGYKNIRPQMIIQLINKGNDIINKIDIKFDKNHLGIQPSVNMLPLNGDIKPGKSQTLKVGLVLSSAHALDSSSNSDVVQMAVRIHRVDSKTNNNNQLKVELFYSKIPHFIFCKSPSMDTNSYRSQWLSLSETNESKEVFNTPRGKTSDNIKEILVRHSLMFVTKRIIENKGISLYFATELNSTAILLELSIANIGKCRVITRSKHYSKIICDGVKSLILEEGNK